MSGRRQLIACTIAFLLANIPAPAAGQAFALDASVGFDDKGGRASLALPARVHLGSRFTIGAGPRLTWYAGELASYRNEGEITPALPRRLPIDPSIIGLNLMVLAEWHALPWLGGGANLDLAGVATGTSHESGGASITPAHGSLFLYGSNDRGSLNSELYLTLTPAARWVLRGGVSHYVTGYRAEAGGTTSRYLRFDTVPFLAAHLAF